LRWPHFLICLCKTGEKMFFDWIYATPTWLWGLIVLVVTATLSCAALVLLRHHFDLQISEEDGQASAVVMQTVGTLFFGAAAGLRCRRRVAEF
jgi:uncharacterized protein (DUF983 family)